MDMWRLQSLLILIRMEEEPIGPEAVHDWHGHLAEGGERPMFAAGSYVAVTS